MSARGEQRREALVSAAAVLLGSDGPQALSARAVARQARVPLAAVSYYFGSVDDLVRAGAERLYDGYLAVATALVHAGLSNHRGSASGEVGDRYVAALTVRVWLDPTEGGPDPQRVRSLLVSLASAADVPALAPRLRRYDESLQALVVGLLDGAGRSPRRVRVLLAALDGFALARLSGVPLLEVAAADPVAIEELTPAALLAGLTNDLLLVWDELAPVRGDDVAAPGRQKSRSDGSSRPDSST